MWPFAKRRARSSPAADPAWPTLVQDLRAMGYFDLVPPDRRDAVVARVTATGFLFEEETGRTMWCDAEAVAEDGVVEWFEEARPLLRALGVADTVAADVSVEPDYVVSVNGKRHTICEASDLDSPLLWLIAQARLMGIVDGLLAASASADRSYALTAGNNDSVLVFMTPQMHAAVQRFAVAAAHVLPLSTSELLAQIGTIAPTGGQPHE